MDILKCPMMPEWHHLDSSMTMYCTTRINKEKKFKIKFQVPLKFAQILPDKRVIQQVNPGRPNKQPKYHAPTISSINKSLSRNRHRVWSPTQGRAIKEESKVANRDWVDHQACIPLQYTNVIANQTTSMQNFKRKWCLFGPRIRWIDIYTFCIIFYKDIFKLRVNFVSLGVGW